MKIYIKTLAEKEVALEVDLADTILDLKQKILETREIENLTSIENIDKLMFSGKVLEDDRSLGDYNIQEESKIYIVVKSLTLTMFDEPQNLSPPPTPIPIIENLPKLDAKDVSQKLTTVTDAYLEANKKRFISSESGPERCERIKKAVLEKLHITGETITAGVSIQNEAIADAIIEVLREEWDRENCPEGGVDGMKNDSLNTYLLAFCEKLKTGDVKTLCLDLVAVKNDLQISTQDTLQLYQASVMQRKVEQGLVNDNKNCMVM